MAVSGLRGSHFRRKRHSGYPETAPKGMKKGAGGAKMGGPLTIKAVTFLLLSIATVKLVGRRFCFGSA
jgi:hypothetical protein